MFLEPEYPFEWAGLFEFKKGEYRLELEDGPDASMNLLVMPLDKASQQAIADLRRIAAPRTRLAQTKSLSEQAVAKLKDIAALKFSDDEEKIKANQSLDACGVVHQLQLQEKGKKTFKLSVARNGAYIIFTQHLPQEFSLSISGTELVQEPLHAEEFAAQHTHDNEVTSVAISMSGDLHSNRFNDWLGKLLREKGVDIFRMKGILSIAGEKERFVFQGVHMLFDGRPDKAWGSEPRHNQLVFIGRNLDREELIEGFKSCLVKTPLPALS